MHLHGNCACAISTPLNLDLVAQNNVTSQNRQFTSPVQVTAEVLQQKIPDFNNVLMQNQSKQSLQLKSTGVQDADIPVVLEALKTLAGK